MKKISLNMKVMIFFIIIFATSGCDGTTDAAKETTFNYETEISSVSFPNDGSYFGDMFFDEENNLCSYFLDTFAIPGKYNIFGGNYSNLFLETQYDLIFFSNSSYLHGENGNVILTFDELGLDGTFKVIWVISREGDAILKYDNSKIEGLNSFEGKIFYIKGGYISVVEKNDNETYGNSYKITFIDINSNTIIPKGEIPGSGYRILNMNEKYIVFSTYDNKKLIVYDVNTGEKINEINQPEGTEFVTESNNGDEIYDCPVYIYNDSIYTFNTNGIYLWNFYESELKCILTSKETKYLDGDFFCKSIVVDAEENVYLQIIKNYKIDYEVNSTAEAKFLKYDLDKIVR